VIARNASTKTPPFVPSPALPPRTWIAAIFTKTLRRAVRAVRTDTHRHAPTRTDTDRLGPTRTDSGFDSGFDTGFDTGFGIKTGIELASRLARTSARSGRAWDALTA